MKPWRWAAAALPRHAREDVLADLLEEAAAAPTRRGAAWVTWQLLAIAWHYHRADLRQPAAVRALALAVSGFVLLQLALAPAAGSLVAAAVALGPVWQSLLATVWGAPAAVAAVAAGLCIGRVQQPAGVFGDAWRWLAVIVGALVAAAAQTWALQGLPALRPGSDATGPAVQALLSLIALAVAARHRQPLEPTDG